MFLAKRSFFQACRSIAAPVRQIGNYRAVNEPILGYMNGSPEREELEECLKKYDSEVHEVPIVIGDEEITTNDARYQVRPFDHQNKLARFYYADSKLINKAISTSLSAQREWESRSLEERSGIFLTAADLVAGKYRMDLMAATMLGQAKTIVQGEIDAACELADFYRFNVEFALNAQRWDPISTELSDNDMILRATEGFWAAVAPFNFTAISGHLAGAPAYMGNSVVWKASDTAMLSSYIVFKILREAGVPAGVINFVPADGPVFGDTVTAHKDLAGINFTGSAKTFHHLWKQVGNNIENYKSFPRLIGECGGKNFHFVHPTADIDSVVTGTLLSGFEYGGQKCSACSRIFVPQSKWAEIKDKLVEGHAQIKLGSPLDADTFLSAVIDGAAFNRIKGYLEHCKSSSDIEIIAGGNTDDSKGYFVEPTIIKTNNPQDKMLTEELFGPVVSVYVYKDAEYRDVLELIDSSTQYALTGSVFSGDESVIEEASDILRYATGNFYINDKSTGSVVSQQPFGGARKSGTNDKAGGPAYILKFCSPQSIKRTYTPISQLIYPYMKN